MDAKVEALRASLDEGEFDDLEEGWMEVAADSENLSGNIGDMIPIVAEFAERGYSERASAMLDLIQPTLEGPGVSGEDRLTYRQLLFKLNPEKKDLRESFADLFEEVFGPTTAERAYFECCNLRESTNPTKDLKRLEKLLQFRPGCCVYHASGWGMGEIIEVDALLKQVKVNLEEKKDHRIAIDAIDSILKVVDGDSFRALKFRAVDELKALAESDSTALFAKVHESYGAILALKDIKIHLVPDIIETKAWTKWWAQAKKNLRTSGYFRVADRAPYRVEKLDTQMSYEDDLLDRFKSGRWDDKKQVARLVVKSGEKKYPEATTIVAEELMRLATVEGAASAEADRERGTKAAAPAIVAEQILLSAVLVAKMGGEEAESESRQSVLVDVLTGFDVDLVFAVMEGLSLSAELEALIRAMEQVDPEERVNFLRRGMYSSSDNLREEVCRILDQDEPELLGKFVSDLLGSPRLGPEAFCWLVEKRLKGGYEGKALEEISTYSDKVLLNSIMDLLEHMIDRSVRVPLNQVKDVFRRVELILYFKKGDFFRGTLGSFRLASLQKIHKILLAASEFMIRHGTKLIEAVTSANPEVSDQRTPDYVWWDDSKIYVTQQGYDRKREEFRELTEEKIPANFEAVGRAREFGDLSENAEYTAALEERDMLTKKGTEMESDLAIAVVISPEDVDSDVVTLGHRVSAKNLESDEVITYSILGPWDGSPENGVLNYKSPLGQTFLGRELEEEFIAELPGGNKRYQILEIISHFDVELSSNSEA